MPSNEQRINRLLKIQQMLMNDLIVNKTDFALEFGVNHKTVQRDVALLNCFYTELSDQLGEQKYIEYSREKGGYYLFDESNKKLSKEQILATVKILLESRAFCKEELDQLLDTLILQVDKKMQNEIRDIVGDEKFNYVPLKHNKMLLSEITNLSNFIRKSEKTEITYRKLKGETVTRIVKPVAIVFSEFYFYLLAFRDDEDFGSPSTYRFDRIIKAKATNEKFYIPYSERFRDGEFRKRVQFMYAGELMKVKFQFYGESIEPILERLPTAKVISCIDNIRTIEAEVYGTGIKMWLLSQGSKIKVLSPNSLVEEMKQEAEKIKELYD